MERQINVKREKTKKNCIFLQASQNKRKLAPFKTSLPYFPPFLPHCYSFPCFPSPCVLHYITFFSSLPSTFKTSYLPYLSSFSPYSFLFQAEQLFLTLFFLLSTRPLSPLFPSFSSAAVSLKTRQTPQGQPSHENRTKFHRQKQKQKPPQKPTEEPDGKYCSLPPDKHALLGSGISLAGRWNP